MAQERIAIDKQALSADPHAVDQWLIESSSKSKALS